jgi:uncharacterized protein (TIGR00369 family)
MKEAADVKTVPGVPEGFVPMKEIGGFNDHVGPCYIRFRDQDFDFGFVVEDHHCNPAGLCHGGMLMTFVDIMFAGMVCARLGKFAMTPTMNLTCDFVAAAKKGDWLQSELHFVHLTGSVCYISGAIVGPQGVVLRANGTFRLPRQA